MELLYLVLLLSVPATGLNCNLLKPQQRKFNRQSAQLLKGMRAKLPPECLRKVPAFAFPAKVLGIRQPPAATKAILETLQGFSHLFKDDHRWVAWKAALRKRFLDMLHAQTQRIQRCLEGEKAALGKSKEEWTHKLRLKAYFRSIGQFLQETGLDSCAQEFVRHEVQVALVYMDTLTERMKN